MKTIDALDAISKRLEEPELPRAERAWGGAGVVVAGEAPAPARENAFYAEHRHVVTPHTLEVSWTFEQLRDAFYAEDRVDWSNKFEFFGRLANAASLRQGSATPPGAREVCVAVVEEGRRILDEMNSGRFRSSRVSIDGAIVADKADA